jgi:ubiquinone/menaquinone biosynthesis C-methylase UbiE
MTIDQAISLIDKAKIAEDQNQRWADLGCGSGLFSAALASILPQRSHILCMDKEDQTIRHEVLNDVTLEFQKTDFSNAEFARASFHGLLLANSLHYIQNKVVLLEKLTAALKNNGSFIIVEYDTTKSNPWVPYPTSVETLKELFDQRFDVRMLSQMASAYGPMMVVIQAIKLSAHKI